MNLKKIKKYVYYHSSINMILFRIHSFLTKSNNIHDLLRRLITLLYRIHFPVRFCNKLYDLHYKYISRRLNHLFNLSLIYTLKHKRQMHNIGNNGRIWIFWYQGKSNMPMLIRKCLRSVYKHSNGHKIILLTKHNVHHYAKLPKYIYYKLNDRDITLTQFSDILRFNLLKNYGGLWIDSTVFFVSDLLNECFNPLFTANSQYLMIPHSNMSLGRWTEFFIGGDAYQPLFIFMNEFFQLYWRSNNNLLDYFLVDCALHYAYIHNIGQFRNYVDTLIPDPFIFRMVKIGNRKCNHKTFNTFINKAMCFKLSYKVKIKDISNTYYKFLLR